MASPKGNLKPSINSPKHSSAKTVYVKKPGVRVRKNPSLDAPLLAQVDAGRNAKVLAVAGKWAKIQFPGGTIGFIRREFLGTKPPVAKPISGKVFIKSTNVRLRKSPSTNAKPVAILQKGQPCYLLETRGSWAKVKFSTGKIGYVRRDFLTHGAQNATTNTTTTNTNYKTLVVKKGDNDYKIAKRLGITVAALHSANPGVKWSRLQIGQKLRISSKGGKPAFSASGEKINYIPTRLAKINRPNVSIRRGPSTKTSRVTTVDIGTVATILGRSGAWYKLKFPKGTIGYVRSDFLNPYYNRASGSRNTKYVAANSKGSKHTAKWDSSSLSIVNRAMSLLGTRYRYGGTTTRGFDCSGFVYYLYKTTKGVTLPRRSRDQVSVGTPVKRSELKPGDIVLFRTGRSRKINHAGVYIGNGKFIHSSSARGQVKIDSLDSGYYKDRLMAARRLSTKGAKNSVLKSSPKIASKSKEKSKPTPIPKKENPTAAIPKSESKETSKDNESKTEPTNKDKM